MAEYISGTDYKAWAERGLDTIQDRHEMEYVNQEEDGCDCYAGEWYIADDDALVIISGTFGNYNSPGASHYTSAEVFESEEEYRAALAEWEDKPEYLDTGDEYSEQEDGWGNDDGFAPDWIDGLRQNERDQLSGAGDE